MKTIVVILLGIFLLAPTSANAMSREQIKASNKGIMAQVALIKKHHGFLVLTKDKHGLLHLIQGG